MSSVRKSIRSACPSLAAQDGELVEQAGLGADPVVLDARAQLRELDAVGLLGAATPSSARHSAASSAAEEDRPEPCGRSPSIVSRAAARPRGRAARQLRHRAAHERAPAGRRGSGSRERERSRLAEVLGVGLDLVAVARLGRDRDAAVDRERQREAVVVVGVLADQVHAAGAARGDASAVGIIAS